MPHLTNELTNFPIDERVISALSHAQYEALNSMADLSHVFTKSFEDYNEEVARFVNARISRDFEFVRELSQCRSLDDFVSVQNAFLERCIRDYTQEMGHLTKMGAKMLSKEFEAVNVHLNAISDEVEQLEAEMEQEKAL